MDPNDSFAVVEHGLRAGDPGAAVAITRRFTVRLMALVHAKLDSRVRRKEDPEDVVQSVLRSFFIRQRTGSYDVANWDSLWSLLAVITKRKCLNRAKHYLTQRRNIKVEVGASSWEDARDGRREPIDPEPTGIEALVLAETVEQVLRRFDADDRTIIELILRGYTPEDISAQLGVSERKVKRVGHRVEQGLLKQIESDACGL